MDCFRTDGLAPIAIDFRPAFAGLTRTAMEFVRSSRSRVPRLKRSYLSACGDKPSGDGIRLGESLPIFFSGHGTVFGLKDRGFLLQYFSYEVPFLLALSGPAIMGGSWQIERIVSVQNTSGWFLFFQPLGFVLALIGLIGKLKRDPLDIPKAKSEILAGPLTEFTGRKLALWHMTINMQTVVGIFLLVNLFLGNAQALHDIFGVLMFTVQVLIIVSLLSTASSLFARLRIDQLAEFGWKILVPLSLVQLAFIILMGV